MVRLHARAVLRYDAIRPTGVSRGAARRGVSDRSSDTPRPESGERGEMLLELLMTTSIVSICVIGLVGALGSNFRFSAVSREINNADQLLSRYAESLAAVAYEPCAGSQPYESAAVEAIPSNDLPKRVATGPSGKIGTTSDDFGLAVESVQYWQRDTEPATFDKSCDAGSDPGVQRLVLVIENGDATISRRVTIIKAAS